MGAVGGHGLDAIPDQWFHHHANHAASAYYGLRKVGGAHLVMTLDGRGDDTCAHVYLAEKGALGCWPPRRRQ